MTDMSNIDPDFEPQTRPRLNTWPLKRPNIGGQRNNIQENDIVMKLEPTIEESSSQEQIAMMGSGNALSDFKQESPDEFLISSVFPDLSDTFNSSPSANCVSDYTLIVSPQQSTNITACDNGNNNLSFTNLESMIPCVPSTACNFGAATLPTSTESVLDTKLNFSFSNTANSEVQPQLNSTINGGGSTVSANTAVTKPKTSSRKNAWGNMSYADLITQGIESSPDKRLTLAQIYDWMVKNVPYFKDKGDSNSSAGWKNSIRHNLSLHSKFKRIQNEGAGKSSWWVINHEAKPGKPNRRRTASLEVTNSKVAKARKNAVAKKNELLKNKKPGPKRESPTWARSPTSHDGPADFEHPLNISLASDFRPRTSSNASSIGGRISPPRTMLSQDLEDDGPPPLSPLSTSYTPGGCGMGGLLDEFNFSSLDVLEDPSFSLTQAPSNDRSNLYSTQSIQPQNAFSCSSPVYGSQMGDMVTAPQQVPGINSNVNANRGNVLSTPNLANLLRQRSSTQPNSTQLPVLGNVGSPANKQLSLGELPRARANTMPRLQPQPKYNMTDNSCRQQAGEALVQDQLLFSSFTADSPQSTSQQNAFGQCQYNGMQEQVQPQNVLSTYVNQNPNVYQLLNPQPNDDVTGMNQPQQRMCLNQQETNSMPLADQQRQQNGSVAMQSYGQTTRMQNVALANNNEQQQGYREVDIKYPSDLSNIDNRDIFNPGAVDLSQDQLIMLQDMEVPTPEYFFMPLPDASQEAISNFDLLEMDTSNGASIGNVSNASIKVEATNGNFPYPTNQIQMDSLGMQQRFGQSSQTAYNASENRGGPQVLLGLDTPSSNAMMVEGTGLPPQYTHPQLALRPQSSVSTVSDYRM